MSRGHLLDSSGWARLGSPAVRAVVAPLLDGGLLWTCAVVEFEAGMSARSAADHAGVRARLALLPRVELVEATADRASTVQQGLVERGHHRGVGLPDLLVAACAEQADLVVLHYDHDFDLIAEVTGQPTQWVVARGSVD